MAITPSIFDDHRSRLDQIRARIPADIIWDLFRVVVGAVLAYAAFLFLNGSLFEWLGECCTRRLPLIGGLAIPTKEFLEGYLIAEKSSAEYLKKESWLALEPFAIFLVLTRNSIGRLFGCLVALWGTRAADRAMEVVQLSEAMAAKHLVSERLDLMFTWLKEYDKDE